MRKKLSKYIQHIKIYWLQDFKWSAVQIVQLSKQYYHVVVWAIIWYAEVQNTDGTFPQLKHAKIHKLISTFWRRLCNVLHWSLSLEGKLCNTRMRHTNRTPTQLIQSPINEGTPFIHAFRCRHWNFMNF